MAARTSSGLGMGIAITLLSVIALGLFIATVVVYSKWGTAQKEIASLQSTYEEIVRDSEIESDSVRALKSRAGRENMSVVSYQRAQLEETMRRTTGSQSDRVEDLQAKTESIEGAESSPLIRIIGDMKATITSLNSQLTQAQSDHERALADLRAEQERVDRLNQSHQETVADLNSQLGVYRDEVDSYREEVNRLKAFMDAEIERIRTEKDEQIGVRDERIQELQGENAILKQQIELFRQARTSDILKPADEYALVDATVIGLEAITGNVVVSVGRQDKVFLGMTFSVYSSASAIRPDESGNYPTGKADIEVIRVDETSSVCRVLRAARGNPIVKGDVVANAVYDPDKTYKFLVFGNFDADGDGVATPDELNDVAALIVGWGGEVVEDLAGDLDFLVLGVRPTVPPEPSPGASIELLQQYIRHLRRAERYDDLFEQARATSIPVLNENRLYTLTGRTTSVTRR